jgi:elongation factor 1-alpha
MPNTIIMLGHVYCGKSALFETLTLHRLKIEEHHSKMQQQHGNWWGGPRPFGFYCNTDTRQEEKLRGITINLHFCHLLSDENTILIDGPGHRYFIANLITGMQMADIGILVVAASLGICRGGQTIEHARLAYIHGVRRLIVVVSKNDERTVNYSMDRYDEIKNEMTTLLKKIGFLPDDICFIPTVCISHKIFNIFERSKEMAWYRGPLLVDQIKEWVSGIQHSQSPVFRLNIESCYRINDIGTIVCGRVSSGTLKTGQTVTLEPSGHSVIARSIQQFGNTISVAKPGDIIGVHLSNIDFSCVRRGYVLVDSYHREIESFTAKISVFNMVGADIKQGYSPIFDIGSANVACRIDNIIAKGKRNKLLQEEHPKVVYNREVMLAKLVPLARLYVECFGNDHVLGRFSVRDSGRTIAAGKVETVTYGKRRSPYRITKTMFLDLIILCTLNN